MVVSSKCNIGRSKYFGRNSARSSVGKSGERGNPSSHPRRLVVRMAVRSPTIEEDRWQDQSTSGSDHRPIARSIIASIDRSYYQSWCRVTDHTINHGVRRSIARSVVTTSDRLYDQSTNRGICDRSYDWSYHQSQNRATNRDSSRLVALRSAISQDGWHHQSPGGTTSFTTNRATT